MAHLKPAPAAPQVRRPAGCRISRWLVALLALAASTCAAAAADQSLAWAQHLQPEELEPANKEKPFASLSSLAVIDGNTSLVCDISPPSSDDSVALILWYKDDSSSPIYTVDARKASSLEKARTSIAEPYANRAHFNGQARPARLELSGVRLEDEGEFRCRVDFKRGRSVNTIIALRLVIPAEEVLIVRPSSSSQQQHKPHTRLEGLIGPFDEGEPLTLVCVAKGGKPRPQITWRRDFNVIDDTQQHLDKEGTSNELKIPALSKTHLLSIFTCQVSNSNLTSPLQASITVDLNLKPQEVTLRQVGAGEPLVAGQPATFECTSHGSRPPATLHWMFRNKRIDTETSMEQQQSSTRLTLTMERSFNQVPLSCVAENPRMHHGPPVEQIIKLDVHYPPQASVELVKPENGAQLQEGIDVYLSCQLEANPRPAKPIVWRFNGKPLSPAPELNQQHLVMSNQSLVLRKIGRQQAGAYTCEASNSQGTALSSALQLDIRHAPACVTDDILLYEIGPKQSVQLQCAVLANPANSVHYSWFLAGDERNLSSWVQRSEALDEQVDESSSRLKLKPKHLSALIKCKAKNEIGLQQKPCLFQVVEAREPRLKHSCALVPAAATADSLQVECRQAAEQLKSEEFELVNGAGGGSSFMGNWINLGSGPRQQAPGESEAARWSTRSVHPPDWLLVELHQATESPPATSGPPASSQGWRLFSYVIVGGSKQHLALIKSLVEENRLLSSAPKLVYYVAARGPEAGDDKGNWATGLKLPANFSFTVPQLEARASYRLLVYGQNLANRTRDWISLRGDTSDDSERPQMNPFAASSIVSGAVSGHHKKSIVPGSDESPASPSVHDLDVDKYSPALPSAFAPEQINKVDSPNSAADETTARLLGSQLSILSRRIQQTLAHFGDQTMSYARQRPLYAILAFAAILVSTLFLLGWTGGRLSRALGGRARAADERRASANKGTRGRPAAPDSPPMKQCAGSPDSKHQNSPPAAGAMSNSNSSTGTSQEDTPPYHYNNNNHNNYLQHHHYDPSIEDEKLDESMNRPTERRRISNLNDTVFTIGRALEACPQSIQMVPHKAANGYLTGSLDRCQQQKQQPIYLAAPGPAGFSLVGAGSQVARAAGTPEQSRALDLRRLELANSCAYNSGSLSSTDCSSAAHNGLLTCRRSARVSFDLSNQPGQPKAPPFTMQSIHHQHQLAHRNRQLDVAHHHHHQPQQQQPHYQIYQETKLAPIGCYGQLRMVSPDQLQQVFQQKGSDSGNTADSGHESPSATTANTTAETITFSQHLQPGRSQHPHQHQHQPLQQQQMLMLMELPPSAGGLLEPIGAAGELQQLPELAADEFHAQPPGCLRAQQVYEAADRADVGLPCEPCSHQQSADVSNWL